MFDAGAPQLRALRHLLESSHWSCDPAPKQGIIQAYWGEQGATRGIRFGFEGEYEGTVDVLVVNDSQTSSSKLMERDANWAPWSDIVSLQAAERQGPPLRTRMGRDLTFPFLRTSAIDTPLSRYLVQIEARKDTSYTYVTKSSVTSLLRAGDDVGDAVKSWSIDKIAASAREGERALITLHPILNGPELIFYLFKTHIEGLLASPHAAAFTRVPLYLRAEDIRTIGFRRALGDACQSATGAVMPAQLLFGLLETGYLHLYVHNLELLRVDYDLDPNTPLISELLASVGRSGSFTLMCDYDFVFHSPVFAGAEKKPRRKGFDGFLRTLGDRFHQDRSFRLYLSRDISSDQLDRVNDGLKQFSHDSAAEVVKLAEGRITENEVSSVLSQVALSKHQLNGLPMALSELTRIIRNILSGDRRRPANVRFIESAVINSGLVLLMESNTIFLTSKLFGYWLLAQAVRSGLEALCQQDDGTRLDKILETRNLPFWCMAWGVQTADLRHAEDLSAALPKYMQQHNFRQGAEAAQAPLIENLLTLILAAADVVERGKKLSARRFVGDLVQSGATFISAGMPQRCFYNLDLSGWKFSNCNLRSGLFINCDLSDISFAETILSGSVFVNCQFGNKFSFEDTDVSGCRMESCQGLGSLASSDLRPDWLRNSNWAVSDIAIDEGDPDSALKNLEVNAASFAAARIHGATEASAPWPISAMQGFLHGHWKQRPVLLRSSELLDGAFVPCANFSSELSSAYEVEGEPNQQWCGVKWLPREAEEQLFVGATNRGMVKVGRIDGKKCIWQTIPTFVDVSDFSILGVDGRATPFQEGDLLISAICGAGERVSIRALRLAQVLLPEFEEEIRMGERICAMRWILPARASGAAPELLIGLASGQITIVNWSTANRAWQKTKFRGDIQTEIHVFGFSPRDNVVLVCSKGGHVFGFRHVKSGTLEPLFRFHTPLALFYDVALLNRPGQMLVVGARRFEPELNELDEAETLMWVLVNASGGVVATVPFDASGLPHLTDSRPRLRLRPDSEMLDRRTVTQDQSRTLDEVAQDLAAFRQERQTLLAQPRLTRTLEFVLTRNADEHESVRASPPESTGDGPGLRFRVVELTVDDIEAQDSLPLAKRTFGQAELPMVFVDSERIKVQCTPHFREGVQAARAILSIRYPSMDSDREIVKTWPFDVQLEWDDNPFIIDGTPVAGKQFFGLEKEIDECRMALLGGHVVVRSCRRAGKSSFIRRVAERLRGDNHLAVVISGEKVVIDGRVGHAVLDALRQIGEKEDRRPYRELSAISLPPNLPDWATLELIANKARAVGCLAPAAVFIDEWGYLHSHTIGIGLANAGDDLKKAGVSLCLTSVPGDFGTAERESESHDYRFISRWMDIGRLNVDDLKQLIQGPLAERNFEIGDAAANVIIRLSSGAPHDANILMHYAFKSAKAEYQASGGRTRRTIELRHILPPAGGGYNDALAALQKKYVDQQGFILDHKRLDKGARHRFLQWAGIGPSPSVEAPEAGTDARWDVEQMGIPTKGMTRDLDRLIFAAAGYRIGMPAGKSDNGVQTGPQAFKLWIPWGMAEYFRKLRISEEARRGN